MEVRLWDLNTNVEHPNVMEAQFTVISSKHVELSLDDVCGMSTPWPWSIVTCLHFFPMIRFDVEHMNIVHPMSSVVAAEIIYF